MRKSRLVDSAYILGLILVLTLTAGRPAWASTLSTCTPETCTWEISVDGSVVMDGMYMADSDGNIILNEPVSMQGDGFTINLDSMNGNIDPVLGFGLGATNTSGGIKTFAFAFSLPLGGLTGAIDTVAQLGTTLTAFTSSGGSVFATSGGGTIVDSQDIRLSPFSTVDKGVDIGAGLSIGSQGTIQNIENATSSINLVGGYDIMSVIVAFGLTDDTGVGFSGFVEQTAVPIPGAVWLFGSGLIGLVGMARRKAT